MYDSFSCGQPLHVARTESRRSPERIRVIDEAVAHNRYRFKATVWVLGKTRNHIAVVHPPAISTLEVLTDVPAGKRSSRSEVVVSRGIGVVMVHAEQKRIGRFPWHTEGIHAEYCVIGHI